MQEMKREDVMGSDSRIIDSAESDSAAEDLAVKDTMDADSIVESDDLEQIAAAMPVNGKAKRIAAMLGVILLVVMILATFIVACLNFEGSGQVFMALLLCDIAIPVFLWFILHFLH